MVSVLQRWLLMVLLTMSAVAYAQEKVQSEVTQSSESKNTESQAETESKPGSQGRNSETKSSPPDNVERFIMPFTHWLEEKVQDSVIANPVEQQKRQQKNSNGKLSLRGAIERAREQYPGTVLSADRIKSEKGLSYRIKILSDDGVVRTVAVDDTQEEDNEP